MSEVSLRPPAAANGKWYASTAPEASKLVENTISTGRPGVLHWLYAENKSTTKFYVFVYDGTTAAGGTLMHAPIPVEAHSFASLECLVGIPFKTGLFLAASSVDTSFSQLGTADAWFTAGYHLATGG